MALLSQLLVAAALSVSVVQSASSFAMAGPMPQLAPPPAAAVDPNTLTVLGVTVPATPQEAQVVRRLLGAQPPAKTASRVATCQDPLCILTQAYGDVATAKLAINLYKKYGLAFSVSQDENFPGAETIWKTEDLQRFGRALQDLPTSFFGMDREIKLVDERAAPIIAAKFNVRYPHFAGITDMAKGGRILLVRMSADADDPTKIVSTFIHELAHAWDADQGGNQIPYFDRKGGFDVLAWDTSADPIRPVSSAEFVSDYARTSPVEDFAESAMNYVILGSYMKKFAPKKFDFMKAHVFEGRQYNTYRELNWPELTQAINSSGGCGRIVAECMKQIYANRVHNGADGELVTYTDVGHSGFESMVTKFFRNTRCFDASAHQLSQLLKNSALSGKYGEADIAESLRGTCSDDFWSVLPIGKVISEY